MIGYDELCLMKPTAFFINTSRGGTYSEADLARALAERKIAGAGIDVFLEEPPPTDHPLMAFDNVILTPHNAGSTREFDANVAIYASDQWIDIFDGKVPPRLINRAAWPKYSERFQKIFWASSPSRWERSERWRGALLCQQRPAWTTIVRSTPRHRTDGELRFWARSGLRFSCERVRTASRCHMGRQSQAPKQVLGVVTLHAICEE